MKFTDCIEIVGSKPTLYNGTKQYVSTGAVEEYFINENSIEEYTYNDRPSRADLVGKDGDILFAKMAETKKTLIINKETEKYLFSTGFFAISPRNGVITTKCLYYLLNSKTFLSQKDKNSSGATQKAITNTGLEKINVNIPPFSKQEQIAKQFDVLTNIINKSHKQLENLDLLIKSRFIEMFGDPVMNPKNWEKRQLQEVCNEIVDCPHSTPNYTNENTGFMCIRTNIIRPTGLNWDEIEYISENEFNKRISRRKPHIGDIVYLREGGILGIAAIINRDVNVALGQRTMLLSPNYDICNSIYICETMNMKSFFNKALEKMGGSASPHINVADIKAFPIPVPPLEYQNDFATFVQQIDKSKFAVQKSLEKAETLYKALMQEYFG